MAAPGTAPEQPDLASVLGGPDQDDPEAHRAGEAVLAQADDAGGQPLLALPAPPLAGAACQPGTSDPSNMSLPHEGYLRSCQGRGREQHDTVRDGVRAGVALQRWRGGSAGQRGRQADARVQAAQGGCRPAGGPSAG